MKSKYSDRDAKLYINKFAKKGVPKDLALRIYTTQLLGNDPTVVLHGGGNTSVKSSIKTLLGKVNLPHPKMFPFGVNINIWKYKVEQIILIGHTATVYENGQRS